MQEELAKRLEEYIQVKLAEELARRKQDIEKEIQRRLDACREEMEAKIRSKYEADRMEKLEAERLEKVCNSSCFLFYYK